MIERRRRRAACGAGFNLYLVTREGHWASRRVGRGAFSLRQARLASGYWRPQQLWLAA